MAKITLPTISSGYLSTDALNAAFADIAAAINNTLSLDGSAPNSLQSDLDLNGFKLLNVASDPNSLGSLATVQVVHDYVDQKASGLVIQKMEKQTATAGQTLFTLLSTTYAVGKNNLAVYVNGVRKFSGTDYSETSATSVTFASGLSLNDKVVFITNDYVATLDLPDHTHTWAQIYNVPVYTTRWPQFSEITNVPSSFTPAAHQHNASDVNAGRLTDSVRGVWVQAVQPTTPTVGDLWFW